MAHDHLPPAQRPSERAGYDALHGWDTSIDAEREEVAPDLLGADLLEELDAGVEWGSEGAVARALLSAALTDVAPSDVREHVLSAVDTLLREPAAVPAFPADAAPVTTLSGVFEKRRPTTESASCIEAAPVGAADAVEQHPVPTRDAASYEGVPLYEPAVELAAVELAAVELAAVELAAVELAAVELAVGEPVCVETTFLAPDDVEVVSLESTAGERPSLEQRGLEAGCRRAWPGAGHEVLVSVGPPVCTTPASGVHCWGGPMVGRRCRSTPRAVELATNPVTSGPVTSGPVASGPIASGPVVTSRVALSPIATPFAGSPSRVGVASSAADAARAALGSGSASTGPRFDAGAFVPARDVAAVVSNLDAPPTAAERSTSARLRDGVMASAFNLAQLAAAIVVGIVIGKAAHLIMAEESAMAWSATAGSEGGLRAEPSRTLDSARASEVLEATEPLEAAEPLGSIEPRRGRSATRPRAASGARAPSRAPASVRPAPAANARPAAACTPASAHVASATALPPVSLPSAAAFGCPPVASGTHGSWAPQPAAVNGSWAPHPTAGAAVVAPRSPHVGQRSRAARTADSIQPPLGPASDDWLGEQLAILGRAERSLLEDDPESAVRSLDEYKARFPDGLLDPQMASIRQRVEERVTAFIFP